MKKLKVFLSPLAEKKIELILDYLESEWSKKSKQNFLNKIVEKRNQIALHPESCIQSKEFKNLYKAVIDKHSSFYYRIKSDEIELITVIDNRQNPTKVLKELKKFFD